MFRDILKTIRKEKGFTQEELAIKIGVVRQTVSKWEKGLSVPDADVLSRIADVLEVSVSELLGADMPSEENRNEVAEQLAKISEQMAIKNNRSKKIWKVIGFSLLSIVIVYIIIVILGVFLFSARKSAVYSTESEIERNVEDTQSKEN